MSSKKLILVSANRYSVPYPVYPLGISYLKAYLAEEMPDLEIRLFDFMTGSFEEYATLLSGVRPDYVGISLRNIDDVNIYRQESLFHYKQIISHTNTWSKIISGVPVSPFTQRSYLEPQSRFCIYGEETSLHRLIGGWRAGRIINH
jgi:hypothetical protein